MNSVSFKGTQESTAELALADWLTEEFRLPAPSAAPLPPRRRRRVPVGLLAGLMLVVGVLAGFGATWAWRGLAGSSGSPSGSPSGSSVAAPVSAGAATDASPTSYDVTGSLTAVGPHSIRISSGSITAAYLVNAATRITRGNTVISLQALKVGEQVTVRLGFSTSSPSAPVAEAITVKSAQAKAPAAAPASRIVQGEKVSISAPSGPIRGPATNGRVNATGPNGALFNPSAPTAGVGATASRQQRSAVGRPGRTTPATGVGRGRLSHPS